MADPISCPEEFPSGSLPKAQWFFSLRHQPIPGILQRLPPSKASRISAIRDKNSRWSVLTAYALLESAVSVFPSPPSLHSLVWDPCGRPSFQGRPEIFFSLSHSPDAAACVTAPYPVGIDIERLDQSLRDFRSLAELMNFQNTDTPVRFLALWTMWESYLKYSGGCSPPRSLRFFFHETAFLLEKDSQILSAEFHLYRPTPAFLAAVCIPRGTLFPPCLRSPHTNHEEFLLQ